MPPAELARLNKVGRGRILISLVAETQKYRLEVARPDGEREVFSFADVANVRRMVKECPGEDVLDKCQTYYDLLAEYVKECSDKFSLPQK